MSDLKMPSITIAFKTAAQAAASRSGRGIMAVIVKDAAASGGVTVRSAADIPAGLTAANQAFVKRGLMGCHTVLLYVLAADGDLTDALAYMATRYFSWLCVADVTEEEKTEVKTWLQNQRTMNNAVYKAVLPEFAADFERVVNFSADEIKVGTETLTSTQYTSRVAGILAGLPLTQSATYATMEEVQDIKRLTATAMDEAVAAGKLIAFHDGQTVRLGTAVTSLQTVTDGAPADLMKIHVLEVKDLVESDLRKMIRENYIGKFLNTYANKLVLLTSVKTYLQTLEAEGVIQSGWTAELDTAAQKKYLDSHGVDTANMTDQQILEAATDTSVFLKATLHIFDAIENVAVEICA